MAIERAELEKAWETLEKASDTELWELMNCLPLPYRAEVFGGVSIFRHAKKKQATYEDALVELARTAELLAPRIKPKPDKSQ